MSSTPVPYPAAIQLQTPERIARWRPLVHWLLAIPHLAVLYVLGVVATICAVISWVVIVVTGRQPEGLAGVQVMALRYSLRVSTYVLFLREEYPPFAFGSTPTDPGDDLPVRFDVVPELTDRNRLTTFFRLILVIPHAIVVGVLAIALLVVALIGGVAVIATGRWPEGLRTFVVGFLRWATRVRAYQFLLTDEYPPFSLD